MQVFPLLSPPTPAKAGDHIGLGNVNTTAAAISLAKLSQKLQRQLIIVTPDTPKALHLEAELGAFSHTKVSILPDWETLPYDTFSPHQDIVSERLKALYQLTREQADILLVPVSSLMQRLCPVEYLLQGSLIVKQGDKQDLHGLRQKLESVGYRAVDQVMEHGEFSARGSLLDLYPMGAKDPYRIDFFDDEVDEIRLFDPDTQRSSDKLDAIELLPAHEFPTHDEGIETFRRQWREHLKVSNEKESVYQQVSKGGLPAGIEYYLPLFFEQTASLFDYLKQPLLAVYGNVHQAATRFFDEVVQRYESRHIDPLRPLLKPNQVYLNVEQLFAEIKRCDRIDLQAEPYDAKAGRFNAQLEALPELEIQHKHKEPLKPLRQFIEEQANISGRVLFSVESQGRREALLDLLKPAKLKPTPYTNLDEFLSDDAPIGIVVSAAEHGFIFQQDDGTAIALITENHLHGTRVRQTRKKASRQASSSENLIRNLAELTPGQPVVHLDHGVGRYLGLQTLDAGGMTTEFVTLEYANQAKLYVPVSSLHLITRYSGGESEHAPLHKLGSEAWAKAKKKAAEKVRDVAAELLDIYAKREAKPGQSFAYSEQEYQSFADAFPFEETDDQKQAISAVLSDMRAKRAMDRLVCGDVGFGKTEVAMRATFAAISASKQVAVLVPTTLLAQQHFENFRDRFAEWPVRVEVLSRFKTASEQKAVMEDLQQGKVDIVIGTHKLIQSQINFSDLGLLIIDEEHRFGVRQKEQIKKLRADVDILTLTATPIPRTLNMAMSGMRDLSIIATPPAKRLAVKTFVRQSDKPLIREAVLREVMRGGQVYFLHNNVETIEQTARDLEALLPEASIQVAHGQMRERELERIMSDFYHQKFNLLVCTTIIETGIDVPSANTIIMDRADHLGLAQLHQLRGRVGRSHHQAYAYLLTPHPKRMTKDAVKRLEAIEQLEDLGAGFALATHDLEIRGAGELLGDEQSGQIASVGFSLYMEMLEQAVEALKEGKEPSLDQVLSSQAEVDLKIPALLPDSYIPDVNTRLSLYKRIASCKDDISLDEVQVELIDRFGLLPDATKNLVLQSRLKGMATRLGITKIDAGPKGGWLEFSDNTKVDPVFIIGMMQKHPDVYRMEGANRLKFNIKAESSKDRVKFVTSLLNEMEGAAQAA